MIFLKFTYRHLEVNILSEHLAGKMAGKRRWRKKGGCLKKLGGAKVVDPVAPR